MEIKHCKIPKYLPKDTICAIQVVKTASRDKTEPKTFSCRSITVAMPTPKRRIASDNWILRLKSCGSKILDHQDILDYFTVLYMQNEPCNFHQTWYSTSERFLFKHSLLRSFSTKKQSQISNCWQRLFQHANCNQACEPK